MSIPRFFPYTVKLLNLLKKYEQGVGEQLPSAWRYGRRSTAREVSAVRMASGEYQAWPPRLVRGSAVHASIAS